MMGYTGKSVSKERVQVGKKILLCVVGLLSSAMFPSYANVRQLSVYFCLRSFSLSRHSAALVAPAGDHGARETRPVYVAAERRKRWRGYTGENVNKKTV